MAALWSTIMPHMPGFWPIVIVVLLFVILFGPSRLPEAARSLGRASKEFKRGLQDDPDADRPALKPDSADSHTSH